MGHSLRERFPGLSGRTANALARWFVGPPRQGCYWNRGGGMPALLAATDAELLEAPSFGAKMLVEFRTVWPTPMADAACDDPWADHAAMIALAG